MSFWNTSEGESVADTGTEFDAGGGNIEPIPNNTDCLAAIDEIKIDEKDGVEYINARWSVMKPEAYQNRKVFQKLWVFGHDPNVSDSVKADRKTDKAKRMLAAIDANSGGALIKSGKMPDSDSLQINLMNKPMVIKVMEWKMKTAEGDDMAGNWVAAVSPASKSVSDAPVKKSSAPASNNDFDEIPF